MSRAEADERDHIRFLVADVGPAKLGLDLTGVTEVFPLGECARVPWAPPWVCGVVHHQGRVVTVVDLGRFLEVPDTSVPGVGLLLEVDGDDLALGVSGVRVVEGRQTVQTTQVKYYLPETSWVRATLSTPELEFHHVDLRQILAGIEAAF